MEHLNCEFAAILAAALKQDLQIRVVRQDVNLNVPVYVPHFHQGIEVKLSGYFTGAGEWQTIRTMVIPPRVVHCSDPETEVVSLLLENSRITCVCRHRTLPRALSSAALTDLGVAVAAIGNFLEKQHPEPEMSAELASHWELVVKVLLSAVRLAVSAGAESGRGTGVVARAIDYINRHYYRHTLTVAEIAEYVDVTPNYLVRRFDLETKLTIRQYLVKVRLEQARMLLATGRCLVKDAARLTGWNSAYYFSNAYRRYFGMAPSSSQNNSE